MSRMANRVIQCRARSSCYRRNGGSSYACAPYVRYRGTRNTDIVFAVVAGFPSKDQKYELEEKNHIGKFKRIIVCQPNPSSHDPALLCLRTNEPLDLRRNAKNQKSAGIALFRNWTSLLNVISRRARELHPQDSKTRSNHPD